MNLAGGDFFTSAIWPFAGVVVGVLSTAVVAWVTLRAANPKRPVLYWSGSVTPLLNREAGMPQLKVSVRPKSTWRIWNPGGQELKFPHIVKVELTSRGRADIAPAAFGGNPLRLDLGAPIVEFLDVTTTPDDRQVPKVGADGTTLLVEPALIGKREIIDISVLVDGQSPFLGKPQQSLTNVDISQWDPASENARLLRIITIILLLLVVTAIITWPAALHGLVAFIISI